MKTYRFELTAFTEIDVKAESKEEADKIVQDYWDGKFKGMFGGFEFIKEVEENEKI